MSIVLRSDIQDIVQPGDGFSVRQGHGFAPAIIDVAEAIQGHPGADNHIISAHNWDADTIHGFEGRPGGYGPVDLTPYLLNPRTINDCGQTKTDAQRKWIVEGMDMLYRDKTDYDWRSITAEIFHTFDIDIPWLFRQHWNGKGYPAQVICSSALAYFHFTAPAPKLPIPEVKHVTTKDNEQLAIITPMDWGDLWWNNGSHVDLLASD